MNSRKIITGTIALLLLCPVALSQQNGPPGNAGAAQPRPTDAILGHGYVKRGGAIHFIGGGVTGSGADATRIDMPSPELLRKVVDSQFGPFKTAEGLDVASFEALSEEYTRDKNRVYYKVASPGEFIVIVLQEADPASFEVLGFNLARDKNHVWYHDSIDPGMDPSTVELVDGGRVYKDKDSVHYQSEPIAGADPASFRYLGSDYHADRSRVYWGAEPVPDADPATFEVLGDSFIGKDKNLAFRSGEPLPDYDVESLELILHNPAGYQIFSDKNGVHVNSMTFPRSKPGKVEVIDDLTVKIGDLVHLVESSRSTPSTLFKQDGKLMAATPAYDPMSGKVQGTITAEVTSDGLKNIQVSPLPGGGEVPAVPDWQMEVFTHGHPVERMIELGKRSK